MPKQRGYPDRRGMGAQSDFLSETFTPSNGHRAAQISRAKTLVASGLPVKQAAAMLSLSVEDILPAEEPGSQHSTEDTTGIQEVQKSRNPEVQDTTEVQT